MFSCFTEIIYCFLHGSLDKGRVFTLSRRALPNVNQECNLMRFISLQLLLHSQAATVVNGFFFLLLFNVEIAKFFFRCWLVTAVQTSGISSALMTTQNHELKKNKWITQVNEKKTCTQYKPSLVQTCHDFLNMLKVPFDRTGQKWKNTLLRKKRNSLSDLMWSGLLCFTRVM